MPRRQLEPTFMHARSLYPAQAAGLLISTLPFPVDRHHRRQTSLSILSLAPHASRITEHADLTPGNLQRFDAHLPLDAVSLDLAASHTLVLIGPIKAGVGGKESKRFLRIIAGLDIRRIRHVAINGEPVMFEEQELCLQHRPSTIGHRVRLFNLNLFPHLDTALRKIIPTGLEEATSHSSSGQAQRKNPPQTTFLQ